MSGTSDGNDTHHTRWRRLVLDDGWTFREVAEQEGVDESTVRRAVGSAGRRRGRRVDDAVSVSDAVDAVLAMGIPAAAAELGCSKTLLRHRLWLAGLINDPMPGRSHTRIERRNVDWLCWPVLPPGGLRDRIRERDRRIQEQLATRSVSDIAAETGLERALIAKVKRRRPMA